MPVDDFYPLVVAKSYLSTEAFISETKEQDLWDGWLGLGIMNTQVKERV